MNKELKIVSGFMLGAVTGAAIGILYAPYSGKRTRKKIKKKTVRMVDDAKDTLVEVADDAVDKANEGIQDISEKTKESMVRLREKIAAN